MDANKYKNALDQFLMCVSSLEYSINGNCTFETVNLISRDDNKIKVPENREKQGLTQRSGVKSSPSSDIKKIGINLNKFFQDTKGGVSITPNMLKKEFLYCKKCPLSNVNRVLSEGDIASSIAFVLTDTVLSEKERAYLDKVLSSIRLEVGKNAYLTSLIKCEGESSDFDADARVCSELLEKQLSLTSAHGFIAFGEKASAYLKKIRQRDEFSLSAFIYSSSLTELEKDKAQKEKLWGSFKKLVKFLNLPRV